MAESLRGGLSLMDSGFGFWSHDIGGFEDAGSADLYKRWVAFGLLSSHSRLHGSTSYRVPWVYDDEACDVLRFFTKLKCRLMPYIYSTAVRAHLTGIPVMRAMHLEFEDDPNCLYLDRQYMLGDSVLVAPVCTPGGSGGTDQACYLPAGIWTHLLSGKTVNGGRWFTDSYDYFSLPVFVRQQSVIPCGTVDSVPDYNYTESLVWNVYRIQDSQSTVTFEVLDTDGSTDASLRVAAENSGGNLLLTFTIGGKERAGRDNTGKTTVIIHDFTTSGCTDCTMERRGNNTAVISERDSFTVSGRYI
jgi:alpha-D-xyloside xylohydrolase